MPFPSSFTWGCSSASYQIEGGTREDGKGLSVWDVFCRKEGAVFQGHTGDVACDHYHRWREDVALMRDLGLKGYRLSLSWPRILPEGRGRLNPAGVAFYDRLLDALLEAGVQPWVTLYHWDYPYELQRRGGWLSPDSPDWFAEYAAVAADKFSDRVGHWITHNEPQCVIGLGYQSGYHAPGLTLSLAEGLQASHHVLLAHGKAVQALRANARQPLRIGISSACQGAVPASDCPEDLEAARRYSRGVWKRDVWSDSWWLDPIHLGAYPEDGLRLYGADAPQVAAGDMATIAQPVDFVGMNIYTARLIRAGEGGAPEDVQPLPGYNRTAQSDWKVVPEVLHYLPRWFHEKYKCPVVITENGHQNLDAVALDGRVHDPQRIDYLQRYLLELEKASDEGVPVEGYFQWTLLDNFEWAMGYNVRVGLVHTDYQTLKRTPKDSFAWYKKVIATNGTALHETV